MSQPASLKDVRKGTLWGGLFAAAGALLAGTACVLLGGPLAVTTVLAAAICGWVGSGVPYLNAETSGFGNGRASFWSGMATVAGVIGLGVLPAANLIQRPATGVAATQTTKTQTLQFRTSRTTGKRPITAFNKYTSKVRPEIVCTASNDGNTIIPGRAAGGKPVM